MDLYDQPDPITAEGAAIRTLRALELQHRATVHPYSIAAGFGLCGAYNAPPGCEAAMDLNKRVVRLPRGGTEPRRLERLVHELGHLALDLAGVLRPHSEAMASEAGARLWLRPRALQIALGLADWDGPGLLRAFGDVVPAIVVFRRLALETSSIIILRLRGRRKVFAPSECVVPSHPLECEGRWLKLAAQGVTRPVLWGVRTTLFDDPAGGRGSAIVVPQDAAELVAARPELLGEQQTSPSR